MSCQEGSSPSRGPDGGGRPASRVRLGVESVSESSPAASAILVGRIPAMRPHEAMPGKTLLKHVDSWAQRPVSPRETL